MKIYLDNCSLQRPLDSKTQLRIIVEAEAILSTWKFCNLAGNGVILRESCDRRISSPEQNTRVLRSFATLRMTSCSDLMRYSGPNFHLLILGIVELCESGQLELIASEALLFEVQRNQNMVRKQFALRVLSSAAGFIETDDPIVSRAQALIDAGLKPLDALHLASAEEADADYFCTCDDRFLRRARSLQDIRTKVVSPIDLIQEIDR